MTLQIVGEDAFVTLFLLMAVLLYSRMFQRKVSEKLDILKIRTYNRRFVTVGILWVLLVMSFGILYQSDILNKFVAGAVLLLLAFVGLVGFQVFHRRFS